MSRFLSTLVFPLLLIPAALLQAGQIGALQERAGGDASSTQPKGPGSPGVVLTKTVGTDPAICATGKSVEVPLGSKVYYCYEIENTSALTFDFHDLEDDQVGPILSNFPFALAPAARVFITAEFVVTADVMGFATWTATDNDTATVASSVDSTTVTISPPLNLTKTVGTDPAICATRKSVEVPLGSKVYYCYEIENTSALTFDLHDLEDDQLGPILSNFSYALAPAATAFITAEFVVTADVIGFATWTATDNDTATVASSVDSTTVTISPPLVLTKTVGVDSNICSSEKEVLVAPGTNVYYCYRIRNDSQATFNLHTLEDSELGPILTNFPFSLAAGVAVFVTAEHTVFADVVNTATWTGFLEGSGVPMRATDTAVVLVHTPTPTATPLPRANLSVLKTDFPDPVQVGEVLAYSVAVENIGPDDATDVRMVDYLPAGTTFLSASPGCAFVGDTVICEWSTIPSGEVRLATLAVRVLSSVNLCNFVQVRALEIDPDPSNNSVLSCTVGISPTPHPADVNEDGRVDTLDILELLRAWKMEFE